MIVLLETQVLLIQPSTELREQNALCYPVNTDWMSCSPLLPICSAGPLTRSKKQTSNLWPHSSALDSAERPSRFTIRTINSRLTPEYCLFYTAPSSSSALTFSCVLDGDAWKLSPFKLKVPRGQTGFPGLSPGWC